MERKIEMKNKLRCGTAIGSTALFDEDDNN